jgi:signal transduction histidine kinase
MGNHGAAGARARSGAASERAPETTDAKQKRSRLLNLSDWPVSRRLFAVIVMALLMGLIFGGLRVAAAEGSAAQSGRALQLANLGDKVDSLVQALQNERDVAAVVITNGPTPGFTSLIAKTDAAAAQVRSLATGIGGDFPANIQADTATMLKDINASGLATLHGAAQSTQDVEAVIASYGSVINDMITLNDQIAQGVSDAALSTDVRTLSSLSRAKELASQQRAMLYNTFTNQQFGSTDLPSQLNNSVAEEISDEATFRTTATPEENSLFNTEMGTPGVSQAGQIEDYAQNNVLPVLGTNGLPAANGLPVIDPTGFPPLRLTVQNAAAKWFKFQSAKVNAMQTVEQHIAGNIVARAQALQQAAQRSALITGIITGIVLLLVLIATVLVARSLVLPLRRLRAGALDIASVQLPERVKQLSDAPDPTANLDVKPIDVLSADEIGQVARAFDQVHKEAVRLAGEEALLRASFNAMFINLSRRSQSLIERLARMIDSLEQTEDDPDRLSNLFSMDHLVTRMRRNSENLLLLAGHESARKWSEPVALADVARAATSEIEQYSRVSLNIQPGVAVVGPAVSDVVHLLAELIENATMFSPKDTQVHVSAQELSSGGVLIEVSDKGIGVSESRLAEMNWRLDNPPVIDVSVSRHMGLFAVARLAERHRIRIRLRPANPQGMTALVWLPDSVIERTSRVFSGAGTWAQSIAGTGGGLLTTRRASFQQGHGRRGIGTRSAPDRRDAEAAPAQSGQAGAGRGGSLDEAVPAASQPVSNWFRARQPSPGSSGPPAGAGTTGGAPAGTGNGTGAPAPAAEGGNGAGNGPAWGAATGGSSGGRTPADIVADPVRGDQTAAGLPMRVPQANLIPGSPADAQPGGGDGLAAGGQWNQGSPASQPGPRIGSGAQPLSAPLQRSPDLARSRLSGFQRGARRAESQAHRAGDGADR